jgi:hypothetical protein
MHKSINKAFLCALTRQDFLLERGKIDTFLLFSPLFFFFFCDRSACNIIQEDKYIYTHTNHVHLCPLRTIGVKHRNFLFFSHRVLTKHLAGTIDEYMPCCQQLIVMLENLI